MSVDLPSFPSFAFVQESLSYPPLFKKADELKSHRYSELHELFWAFLWGGDQLSRR